MTAGGRSFLRDNAFLVAAVSLPVLVIAFFLLASIVPRWLVPPPAYDLVLRADGPYPRTPPRVSVDFKVHEGRIEAAVRALGPNEYQQPSVLFLFDHETMNVREIPFDLPSDMRSTDPPRAIVIPEIAGRRVISQVQAPDGYKLETRNNQGPGILGALFGMNGRTRGTLENRGRIVPIALPSPDSYYSVLAVGWLSDEGQR
jgi:hypothetical protein